MKNLIFTFVLFNLLSSTYAQIIINPTGDDNWKKLIVKTKLLDPIVLPDYARETSGIACQLRFKIRLNLGYSGAKYKKDFLLNENYTRSWSKTIPAEPFMSYSDDYTITVEMGDDFGREKLTLVSSEVKDGADNIVQVNFRRVDINDMLITREDGSTYQVKGKVRVGLYDGYSTDHICDFPTGHGVSLPTGYRYKFDVEGKSEDGVDSYRKIIDLR